MAKKKLLSETQVRRFMGLAGIQPINETGYYPLTERDEEVEFEEEEEEIPMDDLEPVAVEDEVEMDAEEVPSDEAEIDSESLLDVKRQLEDILGKLDPLFAAAGGDEVEMEDEIVDDEVDMELEDEEVVDDEAEMDMEEEEEPVLEGVELQLSQTEIVNEVARRVAKRIVAAKKAQQKMNEALGKRKPVRKAKKTAARRKKK